MKSVSRYLAVALTILMLRAYAGAAIHVQPQKAEVQKEMVFEGTLVKVDADTHVLTLRDAEKHDWYFAYDIDTKVVGPAKDVEGLMGKPGANLKVTYRLDGSTNHAMRIDVMP